MPQYKNLIFKGGGVRGAAYVGAIRYLYENRLMRSVQRVAGTSAGAITAAVLALNFQDFTELKTVADSLDYRKVPAEGDLKDEDAGLLGKRLSARLQSHGLFKNLQCSIRLVQEKGWYSSDYLYQWLRATIAGRFSAAKEAYTFRDFRDVAIHRDKRAFLDLYVTGTDISNRKSRVFSYETTPDMEVALAVRISLRVSRHSGNAVLRRRRADVELPHRAFRQSQIRAEDGSGSEYRELGILSLRLSPDSQVQGDKGAGGLFGRPLRNPQSGAGPACAFQGERQG